MTPITTQNARTIKERESAACFALRRWITIQACMFSVCLSIVMMPNHQPPVKWKISPATICILYI